MRLWSEGLMHYFDWTLYLFIAIWETVCCFRRTDQVVLDGRIWGESFDDEYQKQLFFSGNTLDVCSRSCCLIAWQGGLRSALSVESSLWKMIWIEICRIAVWIPCLALGNRMAVLGLFLTTGVDWLVRTQVSRVRVWLLFGSFVNMLSSKIKKAILKGMLLYIKVRMRKHFVLVSHDHFLPSRCYRYFTDLYEAVVANRKTIVLP